MGATKTLLPAVIITMLAGPMTLAQSDRNQKAAEIPADLLATLQSDLKDDLAETKSCLEQEGLSWDESLDAERFELNRAHAWLVQGIGRCLAGNANSPIFLYIRAGIGWRKILYDIGQSLQICAQAHPPCPAAKGAQPQTRERARLAGFGYLAARLCNGRRSIGVSV